MAEKRSKSSDRKPRADAQRNRDRILVVAKEAFTQRGANASLDEIAKQAEVGPGTLYRHFPTRDALLEAVYRSEVDKLAAAEQTLAQELPPVEAMRAWMLLFVDYIAAKKVIVPALNAMAGDSKVLEASRTQIHDAMNGLIARAVQSGDLRDDLEPVDFLGALFGVSHVTATPDWQPSARRLVDILIAGSQPIK